MSSSDKHGSLPAIAATLCMTAILAPVAYAQFGSPGLLAIGGFAAAITLSVLISTWGAARVSHKHPLLSALFASSGIRMVAPFVIVLAIVLSRGRIFPIETVYYVVPLYLCMLATDVAVWVRATRQCESTTDGFASRGPKINGEVG